jgi:hypothetical protein
MAVSCGACVKKETRYKYQKRIRDLERDRDTLQVFRYALNDIQGALDEAIREGKTTVHAVYLVRAMKKVWR